MWGVPNLVVGLDRHLLYTTVLLDIIIAYDMFFFSVIMSQNRQYNTLTIMSLFENTLRNITAKGKRLSVALGDDAARLDNTVEDGPLDGTRPISDEAWDLAQDMVTDCYQLISILTPRRMQALKFAFSASLETAIGIAAHFKIADHIEELGGTASVKGLAEVCGTDATKLCMYYQKYRNPYRSSFSFF